MQSDELKAMQNARKLEIAMYDALSGARRFKVALAKAKESNDEESAEMLRKFKRFLTERIDEKADAAQAESAIRNEIAAALGEEFLFT